MKRMDLKVPAVARGTTENVDVKIVIVYTGIHERLVKEAMGKWSALSS